jgi:hypothetical protein
MASEAAEALRIPLEAVVSSNLAAVGYDPVRRILAVEFRSSGAIFHYAGLPDGLYTEFRMAPSLGSFFARNIKGKYQAAKMTGPCPNCGGTGWIGATCEDCGTASYESDQRERATFSPTRVLIDAEGLAKSPERAKRDDGVEPEVIFVREDGWSLGAPLHLMNAARALWRGSWTEQWVKDPGTGRWVKRWPLPDDGGRAA